MVQADELDRFVNDNIDLFHKGKIRSLQGLQLNGILRKKNPYLFKAKNLSSAHELVSDLLNAFLYSSEEKLFGDFLEALAIFVSGKTCGGWKSSATGVDLEFKNDGVHYLVSIKSGTNWGNSTQQRDQERNFQTAVSVMKQSQLSLNVQPVLGICYGRTRTTFLRGYMKSVGQSFWHLISGDEQFYTTIIEPLGYRAKEHNDKFFAEKNRVLNLFTQEFMTEFCIDGVIDWSKLVHFNSGNLNLKPVIATTEHEVQQAEPELSA
jgi:hypothetical protein